MQLALSSLVAPLQGIKSLPSICASECNIACTASIAALEPVCSNNTIRCINGSATDTHADTHAVRALLFRQIYIGMWIRCLHSRCMHCEVHALDL